MANANHSANLPSVGMMPTFSFKLPEPATGNETAVVILDYDAMPKLNCPVFDPTQGTVVANVDDNDATLLPLDAMPTLSFSLPDPSTATETEVVANDAMPKPKSPTFDPPAFPALQPPSPAPKSATEELKALSPRAVSKGPHLPPPQPPPSLRPPSLSPAPKSATEELKALSPRAVSKGPHLPSSRPPPSLRPPPPTPKAAEFSIDPADLEFEDRPPAPKAAEFHFDEALRPPSPAPKSATEELGALSPRAVPKGPHLPPPRPPPSLRPPLPSPSPAPQSATKELEALSPRAVPKKRQENVEWTLDDL